jgi:hypothetical protein
MAPEARDHDDPEPSREAVFRDALVQLGRKSSLSSVDAVKGAAFNLAAYSDANQRLYFFGVVSGSRAHAASGGEISPAVPTLRGWAPHWRWRLGGKLYVMQRCPFVCIAHIYPTSPHPIVVNPLPGGRPQAAALHHAHGP